jgi:DNA-binding PadR family transcriptional regulator
MASGRKQKRFSSEYTMLSSEYTMLCILEYLYVNAQNNPITKYKIVTNTPGIRQQRPDRVNSIMETIEENEYIKSIKASSTVTFYQITERGIEAYSKWIKDYLNFARISANRRKE